MHRIEENDRQEGLKQAWHELTVIREGLSLAVNWLTEWDVIAAPMFTKLGEELVSSPYKQLVCTDDARISIGAPYNPETFRPITNAEFLQLVRDCVGGTGHKLVSIGSIRNRGRTFASLELIGLDKFASGGRTFEPFLNFGNGHDKSSVLWANTSNVCTVCDNTFSMNLFSVETGRDASVSVQQRHTKHVAVRFPAIAQLVDQAIGVQYEFAQAFESLAGKAVTSEQARNVYAGFVAPVEAMRDGLSTRATNTVARLVDLFESGRGNRGENRADLFSGASEYYTHENAGNGKSPMRQLVSADYGTGAQRKRDFWGLVRSDESLAFAEERGAKVLAIE